MSGVIDTNLLLYAVNRDCPEHEPARAFLRRISEDPGVWYLTEGICYEFLRVATHPRVFPKPLTALQALDLLDAMLAWPSITLLRTGTGHWAVLRRILTSLRAPAGNLFFDTRTATLMRENGIKTVYTADTDFLQFADLEVINPLRS